MLGGGGAGPGFGKGALVTRGIGTGAAGYAIDEGPGGGLLGGLDKGGGGYGAAGGEEPGGIVRRLGGTG